MNNTIINVIRSALIISILVLSEYDLLFGVGVETSDSNPLKISTILIIIYLFASVFVGKSMVSSIIEIVYVSIIVLIDPSNLYSLFLFAIPVSRVSSMNSGNPAFYLIPIFFSIISFVAYGDFMFSIVLFLTTLLLSLLSSESKKEMSLVQNQIQNYIELLNELKIRSGKYETQAKVSSNLFTYKKDLDICTNQNQLLESYLNATYKIFNADMVILYIFTGSEYRIRLNKGEFENLKDKDILSREEGSRLELSREKLGVPIHYQGEPFGRIVVYGKKSDIANNNELMSVGFEDEDIETISLLNDTLSYKIHDFKVKGMLRKTAYEDRLTTLPNRVNLESRLYPQKVREAIEKKEKLFAVMIDIDDFKGVNDVFGHDVGDIVLKGVALTLKDVNIKHKENRDVVARWGGEEFAGLVIGSEEVAEKTAELYRKAIEDFDFPQRPITVSVGWAEINLENEVSGGKKDSLEEGLKKADIALYEAKNTGKNRTVRYKKELDTKGEIE